MSEQAKQVQAKQVQAKQAQAKQAHQTDGEVAPREMIRIEISELVNQLNNNYSKAGVVREMVGIILHDIFCIYHTQLTAKETAEFITVIYQLILHSCKSNPAAACYIICGFIQFSHSTAGYQFKPMVDHMVQAALDGVVENTGWSVLKPLILSLVDSFTYSLPNAPFTHEPFFNHMVDRIVKQLYLDANEAPPYYNSDLCANLPREKSFVWGWFARYIAVAYFPTGRKTISSKQMRTRLMNYRKLIGKLQQKKAVKFVLASALDMDPEIPADWAELVTVLNVEKYKWAQTLIFTALSVDESSEAEVEAQAEQAQEEEEEEVEAQAEQAQQEEVEAQAEAEQAQQQAEAEQAQQQEEGVEAQQQEEGVEAQQQEEGVEAQAEQAQQQKETEENKEEQEKLNEGIVGAANLGDGAGGGWLKWIGWA